VKARAHIIYDDGTRRLVAIETVSLIRTGSELHCGIQVSIETAAVIVREADASYALDPELGRIPLAKLKTNIPELDDLLSSFERT